MKRRPQSLQRCNFPGGLAVDVFVFGLLTLLVLTGFGCLGCFGTGAVLGEATVEDAQRLVGFLREVGAFVGKEESVDGLSAFTTSSSSSSSEEEEDAEENVP